MSTKPSLDELVLDPTVYFDSPEAVVQEGHLSIQDKLAVLKGWEASIRQQGYHNSAQERDAETRLEVFPGSSLVRVQEAIKSLEETIGSPQPDTPAPLSTILSVK